MNKLNIESTNLLRGIAILLVVIQHLGGQRFNFTALTPCGGIGVALFLMLSGYGLRESYAKKGVRHYWRNKLSRVAIPYAMWITFLRLLRHAPFCCEDYFLDIFMIHTSYWYISCLFYWYVTFYIAGILKKYMCFCLLVASFVYLLIYSDDVLRAEQSFSFLIGVILSCKKDVVNCMTKIKSACCCMSFFVVGISALALKHSLGEIAAKEAIAIAILIKAPVAISIILLFAVLLQHTIFDRLLVWLGVMSLELYLVHIYYLDMVKNISDVAPFVILSTAVSYSYYTFNKFCHGKLVLKGCT